MFFIFASSVIWYWIGSLPSPVSCRVLQGIWLVGIKDEENIKVSRHGHQPVIEPLAQMLHGHNCWWLLCQFLHKYHTINNGNMWSVILGFQLCGCGPNWILGHILCKLFQVLTHLWLVCAWQQVTIRCKGGSWGQSELSFQWHPFYTHDWIVLASLQFCPWSWLQRSCFQRGTFCCSPQGPIGLSPFILRHSYSLSRHIHVQDLGNICMGDHVEEPVVIGGKWTAIAILCHLDLLNIIMVSLDHTVPEFTMLCSTGICSNTKLALKLSGKSCQFWGGQEEPVLHYWICQWVLICLTILFSCSQAWSTPKWCKRDIPLYHTCTWDP